jgi:hypothetical protein
MRGVVFVVFALQGRASCSSDSQAGTERGTSRGSTCHLSRNGLPVVHSGVRRSRGLLQVHQGSQDHTPPSRWGDASGGGNPIASSPEFSNRPLGRFLLPTTRLSCLDHQVELVGGHWSSPKSHEVCCCIEIRDQGNRSPQRNLRILNGGGDKA